MSTLNPCRECGSVRSFPTVMEREDTAADGSQVLTPVVCIECADCHHFYVSAISVARFKRMKALIAEDRAAHPELYR